MKVYLSLSLKNATPIELIPKKDFDGWKKKQPQQLKNWLEGSGFTADANKYALLPDAEGKLARVLAITGDKPDLWSLAHLPGVLPKGTYVVHGLDDTALLADMALGWQLATYRFEEYKKGKEKTFATLALPKAVDTAQVLAMAEGIFLARNLINRPANDLTPYALANEVEALAKRHGADYKAIKDKDLLKENYPLVHAVGRASDNRPCLADLRWVGGKKGKITLVGKGICFDSGGLDIKPSSGMLLMKKDMGGAANMLALAHAIMSAKLPVQLRVLIPAAENSISGSAFRPKDIIKSRKGITVEIANTDAEGRLILCDALTEADSETPDLLIDFATLTGAARVALGTDMPAFFTDDDALAEAISKASLSRNDPLWRLPLWKGYRDQLDSDVADISSASTSGFGGAITAALYLKEFVEKAKNWVHIDLMAWNSSGRPGRPTGGEVMGVRAMFHLLQERYGKGK